MVEGYCVKCRENREIVNAKEIEMETKKGIRKAIKGNCTYCGTNMTKFIGAPKIENKKIEKLEKQLESEKEKEREKLNGEREKKEVEKFMEKLKPQEETLKRNGYTLPLNKKVWDFMKIILVLMAVAVAILGYRTLYPEKFTPIDNSTCELTSTPILNITQINNNSCAPCPSCDVICGDCIFKNET